MSQVRTKSFYTAQPQYGEKKGKVDEEMCVWVSEWVSECEHEKQERKKQNQIINWMEIALALGLK